MKLHMSRLCESWPWLDDMAIKLISRLLDEAMNTDRPTREVEYSRMYVYSRILIDIKYDSGFAASREVILP